MKTTIRMKILEEKDSYEAITTLGSWLGKDSYEYIKNLGKYVYEPADSEPPSSANQIALIFKLK